MSAYQTNQFLRALRIADAAMLTALRSYGHDKEGTGLVFSLVADGQVVQKVAQAGQELREAVEWLLERGHVGIVTDDDGEFVVVLSASAGGPAALSPTGRHHKPKG